MSNRIQDLSGSEELRRYIDQNNAVVEDAGRLAAGLTTEQFNWKPSAERWSVGECIAHLNDANEIYLPLYRETVLDARRRGLLAEGPFRYGWFTNWFVDSMEPPPKRKVKVPKGLPQPNAARYDSEVEIERFVRAHEKLIAVIRDADGVDLRRAKLASVITRLLVMPLGQWFRFNAAHDRRHLWQARKVIETPGFPG